MDTPNIALRKKIGLFVSLILLITVIAFGLHASTSRPTAIKIGVVIPLTGAQAFVGEGLRDAIELARKDLKGTKYQYDVIYEDSQLDAKTAATAANKLISIDRVDAILDAYAPIGNAISPIAEKNKVVHIGIAFDPKVAEGAYNFLLFTTPETAARTFLSEMKQKGLKKLGIFRVNNQGIMAVYGEVKRLSPEYGITIVSDEGFQPGTRDFKDIVVKSSLSGADLFALLALPPELEILAKQMNDQNLHNQTSIVYFELTQDKKLFEGKWFIGYSKIDQKLTQEFKDAYHKDLTFAVPNIYDAFNTVVRASEKYDGVGKPTADFIAHQIQTSPDVEGSLGMLHVNPDGIIDSPAAVKIIRDGKMEFVR